MQLGMRKEQVLLLLVVVLGVWLGLGYWNDTYRRRGVGKPVRDHEPAVALEPFLADPKDDPGLGDDIFREPSETRPLPPADLPFPPLDSLPPVAVPLPVGQQAGAWRALRFRIEPVVAPKGAGPAAPAPAAPVPAPVEPANGGEATAPAVQDPLSPEQLARRFDRLISMDGFNKRWGFFVGPDALKYKLANSAGPYPEKITIRFRWINERTGKQISIEDYPGNEVKQLQLARTVKNEVESRDRQIAWTPAGLTRQVEFLRWLIQQGRQEPWVFTKALERADKHIECAGHDVDAYRIKKRILRARGDLEGEWRLYQELPDKLMESAFRYQGMGEVQAMLGLRELAEANLRKAVERGPAEPRTHGALARFLLAEGRPGEAVREADLARRDRRRLEYPERLELDRTVVAAHLAVGDVAGARVALPARVPEELTDQRRFLEACVAYAGGELAEARSHFEACAAGGKVPDAAFGVAACRLRQGEVVAAGDAFEVVADQNPRLRHLALAGRGLALEHMKGQQAAALEVLAAAQEANPSHPYVLYLLGRQRRRNGDLEGAVEALKQALALRDDLTEALAELALTYQRIYHRDTDASALSHAVRYSDRLVVSEAASLDGDQKPTVLFREMQGLFHFEAGDYRGARAAFEAGQGQQSEFCKIGLAIVAYKQKRYEEARDVLADLSRHLPLRHPERVFAESLLERMDAHDNLEQIQDTFDGEHLPRSWKEEVGGGVHPRPGGGQLRIASKDPLPGRAVVMAWRELDGAGRFVSLDVSFKSSGEPPAFVGVEINNLRRDRRGGQRNFTVRFGLNEDGVPFLRIEDGRKPKPEEAEPVVFRTATVHKDRMNHLRLEAVPEEGRQDIKTKTLFLRAYWNGEPVHERKLRSLRRRSGGGPLNLELKVETRRRTRVDVAFDNFRLVQLRGD